MSFWTTYLGGEIRFVTVDGRRTRCAILGDGPPLVLLHGRGGHLETFVRNVGALSRSHRTVAIDLPGHGLSDPSSTGRYDVETLAGDVIAVIEALVPNGAVDLAGQSLGGWIAAQIALVRPQLVRRLALIEPSGLVSSGERVLLPAVAARVGTTARALADPTRESIRERLAMLLDDPQTVDDEMIETRWRFYTPAERRAVHKAVARDEDERLLLTPAIFGRIKQPLLFVRGEHGHTPVDVINEALAAHPGSTLVTVPKARQWPQFEQPDAVNAALVAFFSESKG